MCRSQTPATRLLKTNKNGGARSSSSDLRLVAAGIQSKLSIIQVDIQRFERGWIFNPFCHVPLMMVGIRLHRWMRYIHQTQWLWQQQLRNQVSSLYCDDLQMYGSCTNCASTFRPCMSSNVSEGVPIFQYMNTGSMHDSIFQRGVVMRRLGGEEKSKRYVVRTWAWVRAISAPPLVARPSACRSQPPAI